MKKQNKWLHSLLSMLLCFVLVLQPMSGFVYGDDLSGAGPGEVMAEEGAAGGEIVSEPVLLTGEGTAAGDDGITSWYINAPDAETFTIKNEAELRYLAQLVNGTAGAEDRALLSGMGAARGTTPGAIGFVESTTPGAMGFAVSTTPGGMGFGASTTPSAMSFATSSTPSAISFTGKTIKLAEDIELADGEWIPIGTEENSFSGTFDGDGHTISGLEIDKAGEDYQGLFGYAKDAVIKNVAVGGAVTGGDFVGGIVGFLAGGELDQCVNKAEVVGNGNIGGIAGGVSGGDSIETGVIRNCANLAKVEGEDGTTGSLAGGAGEKVSIVNSFSYWEGGAGENIPPLCSGTAGIINSYYLSDDEDDSEQAKSEEAFKYGEVAYLLDGGAETHNYIWTQGEEYPVLGEGSVHKLTLVQPETPYEQGTMSFAKLAADGDYKILIDADGREYVYLFDEAALELKVERDSDPEFANYQPSFYPDRAVEKQVGEGGEPDKYLARGLDQDVYLTYHFWKQVPSDIDWYLNGPSDPYQIGTEGELLGLAELVNGTAKNGGATIDPVDFADRTIELTKDISVTGKWTPIGNMAGKQFKGVFDGKNFKIEYELGDEAVPVEGTYLGLFGNYVGTSSLKTIIKNLHVSGKVYAEGQYVGGIVGYAQSSAIDNCSFQGVLNGQITSDKGGLGGILGAAASNVYIDNCENRGEIMGEGNNVGGVIGYVSNTSLSRVSGNTNIGSVAGTADNVGGIVGLSVLLITGSSNEGSVAGNNAVGGIVGSTTYNHASNVAVSTSVNKGAVAGTGTYIGGIAGKATGSGSKFSSISSSYNYNIEDNIVGAENVGSILGGGTVARVVNCFSYTIPETSLPLNGEGVTTTNSYYLSEQTSGDGLSVSDFKYGKAAWLLDGGTATHSNVWTQGEEYPVLGTGSVFRLILLQPGEPYQEGAVTLGTVQSEDSQYTDWPLIAEESGHSYYLPKGLTVALNVDIQSTGTPGESKLIFIPANKVAKDGETDPSYTVKVDSNIDLSYEFVNSNKGPVGGAWYNDGAGNAEGKFIVETEDDLRYLAKLVAGTASDSKGEKLITDLFPGKTVELGADIALSNRWSAIGTTSTKSFKGTFAGNNHTISGLDIISADSYQGLFGYTSGGAIKDLKVSGKVSSEGDSIGGIVGYALNTNLTNCHFLNVSETELSIVTGRSNVGGLAGYIAGTVIECSNTGNVTGATQYVGGITGQHKPSGNSGEIKTSYNAGTITGGDIVGGIVGEGGRNIENCYNLGEISGGSTVGGIAGKSRTATATIKKSYNQNNVTGSGNNVGGIVGEAEQNIENCYNLGEISGRATVGGIAGKTSYAISYCFSLYNKLSGSGSANQSTSYYLSMDSGDPSSSAKNAEAFQYGEVARLLDSGKAAAAKAWTQGDGHPVLKSKDTTGPVYKLTLEKMSGSVNEAGTVELAKPAEGSNYKIFTPEDDPPYAYVPVGTDIQLNAVRNPGYEDYWLEFTPKDLVSWVTEGNDKIIYQATMPEDDTVVYWQFTLPVAGDTTWYDADPNKNTFTIGTYPELLGLAELVNGKKLDGTPVPAVDFTNRTISLKGDINITSGYAPIGTAGKPFTGIFDGAGRTISGLVIATQDSYQGLFGYVRGGEIKNVTSDGNIKSGGDYVGGIAGYAENSKIDDCRLAAPETGDGRVEGRNYVGGIAGYVTGSVINGVHNTAKVLGNSSVGGIIGQGANGSKLSECANTGEISGGPDTGGIAGSLTGIIAQCTNEGSVTGKSSSIASAGVGGIAGYISGEIRDSLNQETVSSVGGLLTGGIVGRLSGTVTHTGNIAAITSDYTVGGIAGDNQGTVAHSYNRGQIESSTTGYSGAGGITGSNQPKAMVKYCYNYGTFSGTATFVGAITGSGGFINNTNCYYSSEQWKGTPADKSYVIDKGQGAFAGGEVAWLLDGGKELVRKGIWSQERAAGGDGYPVLADAAHGVIFKATVAGNSQGSLVLNPAYEYFNAGETVTVTPIPAPGYMLKQISVSGGAYKVDGVRTDKADGSIDFAFTMPEADVLISALFVPGSSEEFTVAFHANGGKFPDSAELKEVRVTAGKAVTQPDKPTRTDKVFLGWFTEASGGEKYDFTVSVTGPLTLYARWKEAGTVIVTFDANGGLVEGKPVYERTIPAGSPVPKPADPKWDDGTPIICTFEGWFTQRSGGNKWNFADPAGDDLNLYARWSKADGFATGTAAAPYEVKSGAVLKELADSVNNGENYAGKYFALGGDIQLDDTWVSIGSSEGLAFQGHFYGRGHTIVMNGTRAPLFGYVGQSGHVNQEDDPAGTLTLEGTFEVAGDNLGTVAAYNSGTISGVTSHVDFTPNTRSNIGGIVGINSGNVAQCENHGAVYGRQNVGGIIGYQNSSSILENCQNHGKITGQAAAGERIQGIGGIVGDILGSQYSSLKRLENYGSITVTGSAGGGIGGIVGRDSDSGVSKELKIIDSKNEGKITVPGSGDGGVGGLIGFGGRIFPQGSSNSGTIEAENTSSVGGLVGRVNYGVYGSDSFNTGTVTGNQYVGGLLGSGGSELTRCYNTGEIKAFSGNAGGLVGLANPLSSQLVEDGYAALNCYSTGSVTGSTNVGGLFGSASDSATSGILNSFWYGPALTATAEDGVVNGISNRTSQYNQNNYYFSDSANESAGQGLGGYAATSADNPGIKDANDGQGSTAMTSEQFASGEVAYRLDTGNDVSTNRPKAWTQDDSIGRPELGSPTYYQITAEVEGSDSGTVSFTVMEPKRTDKGADYAQGDPETPVYAGKGSTIQVAAAPKASATKDGITYSYSLKRLVVKVGSEERNIKDAKEFKLDKDADAKILAEFEEEITKPVIPPGGGGVVVPPPPGGSVPVPPAEPTPAPPGGTGHGEGSGEGDGSGDGGIGTGSGGGIGDGSSDGQGGAADRTASADSKAPSAEGEETMTSSVMAQQDELTMVEKDAGNREEDQEPGGSPTGGAGNEDKDDEDEEKLTVFEIVRDVVKENPLAAALVSTGILGILAAAGWRRYKRHRGDN
ncbi:InlB B-repeat-containing protein [Desulfitobacterium hafniense]|nr:InlB B-repeat-containing protein [Desulfitobacterium hafniense]